MGYTHYWYRDAELDGDPFSRASKDCKKICDVLQKEGLRLAYEFDNTEHPATFTNFYVRFNGVGDAGHETFYIHKHFDSHYPQFDENGKAFAFCKTACKPYDIAVCACLIVFKYWFPDMDVSSDGSIEEWEPALTKVKEVLGEDYVREFGFSRED
jgi:hypothetical protein